MRNTAAEVGEHAQGSDERSARRVSRRGALGVGSAQAIALLPGFSRSGATMSGGLLVGLSNEDAARYSFLLATPIIGAAALLKLPELAGHQGVGVRGPALAAPSAPSAPQGSPAATQRAPTASASTTPRRDRGTA
jgi:undecaprenyl-diphosphatase